MDSPFNCDWQNLQCNGPLQKLLTGAEMKITEPAEESYTIRIQPADPLSPDPTVWDGQRKDRQLCGEFAGGPVSYSCEVALRTPPEGFKQVRRYIYGTFS